MNQANICSRPVYWTQRSAWSYRNFPVHAAAFSRDGTIAALAHGPVVSLWDIESNNLLKVLAAGAGEVKELLFVGDEGRYLVGAGQGLISWDLFSCEGMFPLFASEPQVNQQADASSCMADQDPPCPPLAAPIGLYRPIDHFQLFHPQPVLPFIAQSHLGATHQQPIGPYRRRTPQ